MCTCSETARQACSLVHHLAAVPPAAQQNLARGTTKHCARSRAPLHTMSHSGRKVLGLLYAALLLVAHCTWPTLATCSGLARRQLLQGTDQSECTMHFHKPLGLCYFHW